MQKPPDPARFASALAPALRRAGAIAASLEGRVANRPKRGEATPVKAALTAADHASQEELLGPLLEHFPDVALDAEEETPLAARFRQEGDPLVVVDPIDGTLRFYLEGLGPYAVMMGLALHGEFHAALVSLPREGLHLAAVRGEGAWIARHSEPPRPARPTTRGRRVLISHDLPGPAVEVLLAHGFEVAPGSGGAISVAPLLPGVRAGLRLVREGAVSRRGRVGALITAEGGGRVCDAHGNAFPTQIDAPGRALLVAGNDPDLAVLVEALRAADAAAR